MGLGLDRSRHQGPGHGESSRGIRVLDAFDINPSPGLDHEPGVVLVLDSFVVEAPTALIGKPVRIQVPSGGIWDVAVGDVRDHGKTISLFIKDLSRADLPAGSLVDLNRA